MLAWQEERRRWVRGYIKITESVHVFVSGPPKPAFLLVSSMSLFLLSKRVSSDHYHMTVSWAEVFYSLSWNTRRRTPYILQKEFFSAEKRSAQLAFLQIPRRAFLCVFVCVVFRAWMKHTRFERSLLLKIFYLSGFAVSSITGWNNTFIGFLSNINQFPRSVASYFPLASFRDILTSTGYTLQGDWPQKP